MAGTCEGCGRYVDSWGCFDCYLDDLAPEPLTHAAAVSGCTGTGEDSQGEVWLHSGSALAWFLFVGDRYTASQYGEPEGCTATTAVLEGVDR